MVYHILRTPTVLSSSPYARSGEITIRASIRCCMVAIVGHFGRAISSTLRYPCSSKFAHELPRRVAVYCSFHDNECTSAEMSADARTFGAMVQGAIRSPGMS